MGAYFLFMDNNATIELERRENTEKYASVNSIQTAAYVERMSILGSYANDKIYKYDLDNLYPQKILSICDRSWALSTATKTYSDFITGMGFKDERLNELVINSGNETAYEILRQISNIKSKIGFALHFNYTIEGLISEVNIIDFELLRFRTDNGKIVWKKDWQKYNAEVVEYYPFNPENVRNEILESGGIENYTGQVYYWKNTTKIYPLATFDAVLDDGQYQAESKLFSLRNIQNDFSGSGAFIYPRVLEKTKELEDLKNTVKGVKGANNAGKVFLIGITSDFAEFSKGKLFQPFERNNVDSLFTNQNKEARESIFSIFRQPAILNAISETGMFNQQSLQDAFIFYNSVTQQDRQEVETVFKKIFENSIWSEYNDFSITPKMLVITEGNPNNDKKEIKEPTKTE